MFVFFYDDDEVYSHKIIRGLEKMDDELHNAQGNLIETNLIMELYMFRI